jgi:hypothetical protein
MLHLFLMLNGMTRRASAGSQKKKRGTHGKGSERKVYHKFMELPSQNSLEKLQSPYFLLSWSL